MQQFFGLVNSVLQGDPETACRHLAMVVYKVRPHLHPALECSCLGALVRL